MTLLPKDCSYKKLNGRTLRELNKIKCGKVAIAGPISKDYEVYQRKNHPDTTDIAATVVMGAPFPLEFCKVLNKLIEIIKPVFKPFDVRLQAYKDNHMHATVSPVIRTTFDLVKDQEIVNKNQEQEIKDRNVSGEDIKTALHGIPPFNIKVYPWNISIKARGEILLWGREKNKKESRLSQLRERLIPIAGQDARDTGPKVHIALATINDFHKLTIFNKEDIAENINIKLKLISDPGEICIEKVLYVKYGHRSLSKILHSEAFPLEA